MVNNSLVKTSTSSSIDDYDWAQPARASCGVLKWIGGYLCFALVSGIVLNGIIIYILLRKKTRRSPIDVFMIALCSFDLLGALLGIPLPLSSSLACRWVLLASTHPITVIFLFLRWLYGKYLCYYEGFVAYFVGMVGLYLLVALSLNRFVFKATSSIVSFSSISDIGWLSHRKANVTWPIVQLTYP